MANDRKLSANARLRAERIERGWSQQDLADKVGTTPLNVGRWERSITLPTPYFRQKLCELYDKTPEELGLVLEPMWAESAAVIGERVVLDTSTLTVAPPVWNMPYRRNLLFTGREDILAQLHSALLRGDRPVALVQPQAIIGLGGIGKTQTAIEYAYRYRKDFTHVFWIQAATRETLVADYLALAQLLELPEPQKDVQYQTRIIAAVKRWLAANDNWLLIMENADDLPMAQEFLPTRHKASILFTTRSQAGAEIAASIEVGKLNIEDGTLLLLRASRRLDVGTPLEQVQAEDRTAAERIVQEMDGLPLAIVQAGAYIDETDCSLADYSRLYATKRKALLARPSSLLLDYSETVTTTWSLSFQQIEQQSPIAANVLRLCAFLAPDAIPEELLTRGIAELSAIPGTEGSDALELEEALAVLRQYSLLYRNLDSHMLTIHRLVQAILKESLDEHTRRLWAERTVRVTSSAFPEADYAKDSPHQYYLPHVQECARLINEYHLYFPEAAQLLYKAGVFLHYHGFYSQSQVFHQQALAIRKEIFVPDHPDVADCFNALGMLSRIHNDFEQAERFYQQALAIREKTLGPNHYATAVSLNNLGVLYRIQGKYEQAEPLLQQALRIYDQLLGPEHHNTLITFLNLAKLYLELQKYKQAEELLQQALATSERVLEPEDPLIAYNLNLLASLSYKQGNHERAEKLWGRSITLLEKIYGPEHPALADNLNQLAKVYLAQGDYMKAQALCQRALSICEKTLGAEHPDTADVLNSLAVLYETEGKYDQAEPLYRHALKIRQQALGEEDPSVAESLNNLAELYRCKGSYDQAETLFLQALAIRQRIRGDQHPEIAASLNNLAGLYFAREDYARAEQLFREALAISQAVFGESHPEVALQLNNLAEVYRAQSRYEEAEALFRRVLALFEATYGPHHPNVATVLNNLASTLQGTEHVEEAEALYRRALDIDLSHFGPNHPNVATDLSNLATLLYRANRFAEAEELYRRALSIDEASLGHEHPVLGIRLNNLASTMLASHHVDEARALLQRASRLLEQQGASHRPLAQEVREKLEALQ